VPLSTLASEDHSTYRSRGFNSNHRGPAHLDAGGYDFFEHIFVEPESTAIKVLNVTNLGLRTMSTYRYKSPSLASITLDTGAGTSMTLEPVYPYAHAPFSYLDTIFTATKNGPSAYTGTLVFNYDTGDEVAQITIVRVLDAPWRPLDKFTESLEWRTRVIKARSLETRSALREYPRVSYGYEFLLLGRELNVFRAAVGNPEIPLLTPLWYDEYPLGAIPAGSLTLNVDTTNSEFVGGGYVFLVQEDGLFEFVEVLTITDSTISLGATVVNNYSNVTIMPAVLTLIKKANYDNYNNDVYKGSLSLVEYGAIPRIPTAQTKFDSIDVLTTTSIIKTKLQATISTRGQYLDNGVGIVRFKAIENRVRNSLEHLWATSGYEQRAEMKNWLYSRAGQQKKFLMSTFQNDLFLATDYLGGTSMDVLAVHFDAPFYFQVQLTSGASYYGFCTSKVSDSGVDTLTIDPLAAAFTLSDVKIFSIVLEQRYASDKFKITYKNHQIASLKTLTTGV